MSRTDKDRPWWVVAIQDPNYIDHDHRRGTCIEETPEYISSHAGRRRWQTGHNSCGKRVVTEFNCRPQKVDGRRTIVFDFEPPGRYTYIRDHSKKTCWSWICDCEHNPHSLLEKYYCKDKYFFECGGHWSIHYDSSIPCICDTWDDPPTCSIASTYEFEGRYRYCSGGVPSWFVRQVYHRPERRRERDDLRELAREYNTYGELEDDDFFNQQARNSARWDWW